jgi:hypothetical protein
MINTQDLEKILSLSLFSAHINGEKAVSLMIVSDRPESGKSEIAMKFLGNQGVRLLSDVTAYALWRDFKDVIENGSLKTLVIPEFLAPLSRKSETVQSFISTLQMLIEEGMLEIHTGFLKPMQLKSPAAIGAVVCMPRNAFAQHRLEWELSGFLSRFLVISYKYDSNTTMEIFDSIADREYMDNHRNILFKFPKEPVDIDIPPEIREMAKTYVIEQTESIRKSGRGYGFRELKNMLRLLCANVLLENSKNGTTTQSVKEVDFIEIKRLSYLINEEFNALKSESE